MENPNWTHTHEKKLFEAVQQHGKTKFFSKQTAHEWTKKILSTCCKCCNITKLATVGERGGKRERVEVCSNHMWDKRMRQNEWNLGSMCGNGNAHIVHIPHFYERTNERTNKRPYKHNSNHKQHEYLLPYTIHTGVVVHGRNGPPRLLINCNIRSDTRTSRSLSGCVHVWIQ